jgi:hypothetical protein
MAEQVNVADGAELSAELGTRLCHVTRTPSPLPVREGAVQHQSNHGDMGGPEHQICLSKGVIGKYVLRLELSGG